MKPRHERSRSTTSTYSPPLVSQDAVAQPEESVVRPTTTTKMDDRVRLLEREAAAAKQREMKVLESLVQQTKEMERAKTALEEARLEVAALRQQQQQGQGAAAAQQWSVMDLMFGGVDEEINGLRARLRAAAQAEERGRKAADELAAALSAVTMEAKQLKAWLADAQAELEAAGAESDRLRGLLRGAEAELWSATERADALASDWNEAAAGWRAREKALLARARAAEAAMDDYGYEFDHLDLGQYGDATEHGMNQKIKRRSILRKFGDLFRRRSLYKPNLAPVLHSQY